MHTSIYIYLQHTTKSHYAEHINPVQLWWMKATKGNLAESSVMKQKGPESDAIRKAYTYHVVQSGRCVSKIV